MNTTVTQSYEIADVNMSEVIALVEKMNRRCGKLHLPAITLEEKGMFTKNMVVGKDSFLQPIKRDVIFHNVTITGISPVLNGWQFVATIDHVTTEGNVINVCPTSFDISHDIGMEQFREGSATCDHCHILRQRNSTYVLYREETKEVKRVGHSCLRDFVGHKDIHAIAAYAQELHALDEQIHAMDDDDFDDSRTGKNIVLAHYLTWVACSIRVHGWISKSKAYEENGCSTASDALILEGMLKAGTSTLSPSEDDEKLAEKALAWIRSDETKASIDDSNEYMWNLLVICKDVIVSAKHTGIAASLIAAYQKHIQREIEKSATKPSEWLVSTDGAKVTTMVTCSRVTPIESQWGTTYAINFMTKEGDKVTWFASNPFNKDNTPMCVEEGVYELTGTVKSLDNSPKYGKTTTLTRCKVKPVREQVAA